MRSNGEIVRVRGFRYRCVVAPTTGYLFLMKHDEVSKRLLADELFSIKEQLALNDVPSWLRDNDLEGTFLLVPSHHLDHIKELL